MRILVMVLLGGLLTGCAAMKEANYKNIFTIAYGQEAEQTAPNTYEVSFRFIVFPGANRAQERESLFTGLQGALARKGKDLGYLSMQLQICEGKRGRAGGSYYISGECVARMLRAEDPVGSGAILIEDALAKAEARKATLERL